MHSKVTCAPVVAVSASRAWRWLALLPIMVASAPAQTIEITPTFNNLGIQVALVTPAAPTATVALAWRRTGGGPYLPAQPLCRLSPTFYAGSLVGLDAGASYDVRLTSTVFPGDRFATAVTRSDQFPAATGTTYHLAVGGSDARDGLTPGTAFATLAHALDVASAGDRILVHDGRYYQGDVEVYQHSGAAGAPIVIENAPAARPVFDGTDPNFAPVWVVHDAARGLYRTPCAARPVNAYLNGQHLYRYGLYEDLRTNRWGQTVGYHADGAHLFVRFPGGGTPGTNLVTIPARTTALTLDESDGYQIRGIEFCYYGREVDHRGIYLHNASSNLIEDCRFHHTGASVALKRASHHNLIQRCRFSESPCRPWSWTAVKEGDTDYESGGVYVYGSDISNEGNAIRFCRFEDMFDGAHLYVDADPAMPPIATWNMDFHDNVAFNCADDGLETDGIGVNVRIYRNRFDGFLSGISIAPGGHGPTYVFRNVLAGWHTVDEYEGYPFKFNHGYDVDTDHVFLYHNTCHTSVPGQDGFLFKEYCRWTNMISRNNIYAGTDHALENWDTPNPVDFDYDDVYTTNAQVFIEWGSGSYATLPAFSAATGQESHGRALPPGFVDAGAGDFRLQSSSGLIDRGCPLPGFNDDYAGAAPDIGAIEFQPVARAIGWSGSVLRSAWDVPPGALCRIQFTPDLVGTAWSNTGAEFTATASTVIITHSVSNAPRAFYRAIQSRP